LSRDFFRFFDYIKIPLFGLGIIPGVKSIVTKMLSKYSNELLYFVISHNAVLTKIGHDFSGSEIEVHIIKIIPPK